MPHAKPRAALLCLLVLTALPGLALLAPTAGATNFAVLLSGSGNVTTSTFPSVAFSPDGSGLAIWSTSSAAGDSVYASRHVEGQGWSRAHRLTASGALQTGAGDTAATPDGFLAAVWQEHSPSSAWAAVFDPAQGWSPSQRLNLSRAESFVPRVAASGPGAFAFLWLDATSGPVQPAVAGWSAAGGWSAGTVLSTTGNAATAADIVGDGSGGATAVFAEDNGSGTDILAWTGALPAAGPVSPVPITSIEGDAVTLVLEQGPTGRTVAAWAWSQGSAPVPPYPSSVAFVAVREPGAPWGAPQAVSDLATPLRNAQVAVLPEVDDEVLVMFAQNSSGPVSRLRTAGPINGWPAPTTLGGEMLGWLSPMAGGGGEPAYALWTAWTGTQFRLYSASYSRATGWSAPAVADLEEDAPSVPALAADRRGAWAVYIGSDSNVHAVHIEDRAAPTFTIVEPAEGASQGQSSCWVRVSTPYAGVTVEANGVRALPDGQGGFAALVPLEPGPNRILIIVTDGNNNAATAWRNVTYDDPLPALADALNQTTRALDNATHEVGHWLGLYSATQDEVANLSLALNDTRAELNGTNEKWLRSNLHATYLEGQLNLTSSELNATKAVQQQQQSDLEFATQRAESAASGATMTMVLALVGAVLGAVGLASSIMSGRGGGSGGGGGGGSPAEATVRGWDPKKKEEIVGKAEKGRDL